MHSPQTDTIVAVSSPPGRSPRGLIRISGPDTAGVLEHVLGSLPDAERNLMPVRLRRPAIPAMLLRFVGPASYTGEDAAELQVPGNAALLDRVMHAMVGAPGCGVRLAEPGEFTFRSYAAGKLDLTQAEGVGATIAAVSDGQLAAAGLLRRGKLGRAAESMVDAIGGLLAMVEAGIDFTDQEDVTPISPRDLHVGISKVIDELTALLARSRSWGAIEALPRVVLVGPPSVGKSTLFNVLLGQERAVIDAMPGTTRDVLAEPMQLDTTDGQRIEVMLVDLAGLDDTISADGLLPDHTAQAAARDAITKADLVLRIVDGPASDRPVVPAGVSCLDIVSKRDTRPGQSTVSIGQVDVSAVTGEGLGELRRSIAHRLGDRAVSVQADLLALQPRHEQALREASEALGNALDLLAPSVAIPYLPAIELLAGSLRAALDALTALGGRLTPDDVIGRVFATFCVGK